MAHPKRVEMWDMLCTLASPIYAICYPDSGVSAFDLHPYRNEPEEPKDPRLGLVEKAERWMQMAPPDPVLREKILARVKKEMKRGSQTDTSG